MELTVAITGASGTIYAQRTLMRLAASGAVETINLIMSGTAGIVAQVETGTNALREPTAEKINEWLGLPPESKLIRFWRLDNLAAKPASGSNKQAGMIVVPCSMGTLGAIATGAGTNLIHRAADVCLKEGRKLVLVPRETPYNAIHLENMLRLARAGARILPASPGFYHKPETIEELVDHLVFRILDQFDIPHSRKTQWTGEEVAE
jgi:4-hydroxy-3-polyprenylbenzoate decarboxylase